MNTGIYRTVRLTVALREQNALLSLTREHKLCLWTTQRSRNGWDLSRVEYTQQSEQRTWSFVFKSSVLQWWALPTRCVWGEGRTMSVKRIGKERSRATTYLAGQEGDSETGRYVRRMGDQCCHWTKMCPVVVPDNDDMQLPVPVSQSKLSPDSYVASSSSMAPKELISTAENKAPRTDNNCVQCQWCLIRTDCHRHYVTLCCFYIITYCIPS